MLCEPYPICIEGDQGHQDTTNCSNVASFNEQVAIQENQFNVYPNPFNSKVKIFFEVKERNNINVEIIDLIGRRVNRLFYGPVNSGRLSLTWDGKNYLGNNVSPGVYFCIAYINNNINKFKLIYLK